MVDRDVEYDTDTISLTSTVESENDGMYYIKGILSEGVGEDQYGNETMKYLVEWDGYPMHQCTWEPEDGLRSEGASVLETWAKVKARMSKREFAKSIKRNESKFEEAQAQYTDSKEIRKEKRAKRRRKLRQLNRRRIDDGSEDDSTDDIPLMQRRQSRERKEKAVEPAPTYSQEIYNSLFVDSQDPDPLGPPSSLGRSDDGPSITQRPVHRKPPLEQSSENEEDSSSSEGSGDSLMGELADKAQRKTRRNPASKQAIKDINLGNSILSSKSLKQKTNDPPAKPATASATAKAQGPSQGQAQPAILQRTLTAPTNSTVANDTGVQSQQRRSSESSAQVPLRVSTIVASTAAPTTSSRATAAASTSNLVKSNTLASAQEQSGSVAAPVSRKNGTASKTSNPIRITNGPKVAQRKEWNTEGVLYDKVKFRYHAEKRSKMEGTPDITKLQFVGAGPTGTIVAKPKRSAPDDNPYGRREMRTRRVQEMDVAGTSRRDSLEEDIPVEKRYPGKVPLICARDRLSRDCPVGPDRCRFIHDDRSNLPVGDIGGYLPPKYRVPPVTCPFWLRKPHGCTKPDNECDFAHKNTGWIPSNTMNAQPIPCDPKEIPHREQIVSKILENNEMASKNAQTSIRAPLTNNGGPPGGRKHIKPTDKTCWYWANKECDKGDKCKFKHYHTGEVAKVSRTTCKFWEQGYCNKTAEQCQYLHGEPQQSGVNHDAPVSNTENGTLTDSHMHDAISPLPRTTDSPTIPSRKPLDAVLSTNKLQSSKSSLVTRPSTVPSLREMSEAIEKALGFSFKDLFSWGDDKNGPIMLDRRAFLLYHPEDHLKELDLITRCLMGHHVEIGSAWFEGSWQAYAQKLLQTGSGVVFVHPDFEYYTELKEFGNVLLNRVRVWSFGYQEGIEYDTAFSHLPFDKKHHCIELFPAGGLIYITDDVFETKPRLALDIVKLFLARIAKLRPAKGSETPWQDVDNINLHWRLCVRPELMEYIYEKCEEQSEALDAGDPDVQARAELYTLLSDTNYIEQDSPVVPLSLKADKYPIMSECRDVADEEPVAYFKSLAQSREKANLRMIRFYAGLHVDSRRDYRHFYIVHTDCSGPSVEQWQREVQTLTGIMTPEECIKELSKDGADAIDQKIDFYEHYLLEEE